MNQKINKYNKDLNCTHIFYKYITKLISILLYID